MAIACRPRGVYRIYITKHEGVKRPSAEWSKSCRYWLEIKYDTACPKWLANPNIILPIGDKPGPLGKVRTLCSLSADVVSENSYLLSCALCSPRTSTWFGIMHQTFRVQLWDLESLFRCRLSWQWDLQELKHCEKVPYNMWYQLSENGVDLEIMQPLHITDSLVPRPTLAPI